MEAKKCARCGCFFFSENDVCLSCNFKDIREITRLNNYVKENGEITNLESLSENTDISINNINRFINNDSLEEFNKFNF